MRFVVAVLACLGVGGVTLALADPSTPAQPEPATVPSSSAPAAAPAASSAEASATAAKADVDAEEKRLLAQGYKPRIRHGQKVFCRLEEEVGTRLGGIEHCGAVKDLQTVHTASREQLEKLQRLNYNRHPGDGG